MAVRQTAGRDQLGELAPTFARLNDDVLFGEVWSREGALSLKTRSIVTVVALVAKGMVDSVVSTASVTSESIAMYVRAMQNSFESENIKTLHRLVGGRVEALEFNVAPGLPFIGVPLKDLTLRKGLLVAGIVRRNGQTVIPSGNDALQEGDDVVIVTTDTTLHSLRDIVK